ncbi:Centrosomal and chromosomal factor [Papilio machaon]|uniref:Centrosomal and chromosomal factor n=1 Tax=Papilio machaon TaxID=76193 RepID=A0A194RJS0_PAPMA|nr:Centrosomal and chromosomal factor [Papilio machaon]
MEVEADFAAAADRFRRDARPASLAPKDYSVPLHVDCSIEYELPDCAKPPQGVKIEPLLMIHPSHFRRLESLRRVPFVNNLPREAGACERRRRRCCRPPAAPDAELAKLARARLKPHPYLPDALDCDIARALPPPHYERFDKRTLQQLPIYM